MTPILEERIAATPDTVHEPGDERHLSLGVIGHVDHGKTSLVKALSGIDTDRLKEEKERGMSIALGFAYLDLGPGLIDLIDVPGHENFVRTMIAGASGIDAALLVVDVNEGVKPQTVEHLDITRLIGVRRGLVVFTKSDLAGDEQRAAAVQRLHKLLKGTYLESAPTVFTSAVSGEGLDELRQELRILLAAPARPVPDGGFYLPVDRVFSVAGHGCVVTGTLRLGAMKVGDELELMPGGERSAVRRLEFHKRSVQQVLPGRRVGVNLRHLKAHRIARGDTVASPGLLRASTLLDAQVTLLGHQEKALQDGRMVRLLFGTTEVNARLRLLSCDRLEPGREAIVQLHTARPVAVFAGERFILRQESPRATIGGGRCLDPLATRHRRSDSAALERLHRLAVGSGDDVLQERLKAAGYAGIAPASLAAMLGRSEADLRAGVTEDVAIWINAALLLYRPFVDALGDMVCAAVEKFHRQQPLRAGAPLAHCRAALPRSVGESVFKLVLQRLCAGKRIRIEGGIASSFGYDPLSTLDEGERKTIASIESSLKEGGLTPPDMEDILEDGARRRELFYMLVERGTLLVIAGEQPGRKLAFHRDALRDAQKTMRKAFPPPTAFTVSEARALLGSTRKYMVPLMEYFDSTGFTRRRGDKRTLADAAAD